MVTKVVICVIAFVLVVCIATMVIDTVCHIFRGDEHPVWQAWEDLLSYFRHIFGVEAEGTPITVNQYITWNTCSGGNTL